MDAGALKRFASDETGAVTIEFVVVVPFFMFLFVFFIDTCMLWFTYNDMSTVAQEAVRRTATREFTTVDQVRDFVAGRMFFAHGTYELRADLNDTDRSVTIMLPVMNASLFGLFLHKFTGRYLVATANMRMEPLA